MAWTTPKTWTTGELVTASMMNMYIRDQQLEVAKVGQYRCFAYNSGGQSVSAGAANALALNSEVYDAGTMHNTVTNNSRVVVPVAGLYWVHGRSSVSGINNGAAVLVLRKNGSVLAPNVVHSFTTAATNWEDQDLQISSELVLAANDYLELYGTAVTNDFTFTATQLLVIGIAALV